MLSEAILSDGAWTKKRTVGEIEQQIQDHVVLIVV